VPLRLSDVAQVVEEAWQVLRAGSSAPSASAAPAPEPTTGSWEEALRSIEPASPLAALVEDLLARSRAGASAADLDAALDAAIVEAAPSAVREGIDSEVARELAPFEGLMDREAFVATHALTVRDRLRETLRLPRIS
jgi:hypothetical protein